MILLNLFPHGDNSVKEDTEKRILTGKPKMVILSITIGIKTFVWNNFSFIFKIQKLSSTLNEIKTFKVFVCLFINSFVRFPNFCP